MKLGFPYKKRDFSKIEVKNNICINAFGYKNRMVFQFVFQIKNLKTQQICSFYLMMINHIMCTLKILTDFCFKRQKVKTKNGFEEVVYSVLVAKMCR